MPLHSFTCLSVVGLDSNLSLDSNSLSKVCKRKEEGNSPIANPAQTREQPNPQTLLPAQTVSPGKLHAQAQSLPATSFPQPSGPASEVQQPSAPARPEAQHRGPFSLHASASKPPRPSGARAARSRPASPGPRRRAPSLSHRRRDPTCRRPSPSSRALADGPAPRAMPSFNLAQQLRSSRRDPRRPFLPGRARQGWSAAL